MRAHNDKSTGLIPATLLAVIVALVSLAGVMKIARSAVEFGPAVGDIVQFDPKGYLPVDMHTQVAATRADAKGANATQVRAESTRASAGGCMLDIEAIHHTGGSLVVEQRYRAGQIPLYRVHWAGQRSAEGAADCGREADLMLDDTNLDLLAMAAGGWGVTHKHIAPSELWAGDGNRSTAK